MGRDRFGPLLRNRIRSALNGAGKSASTAALIGCSFADLRKHLEAQFEPGMSWENHAPDGWHIDHILPCASFDLSDPLQQKQCFHFSNLRPMWAFKNRAKGKKTDGRASPIAILDPGNGITGRRSRARFIVYMRHAGKRTGTYYAGILNETTRVYKRIALYDDAGAPVLDRDTAERIAASLLTA